MYSLSPDITIAKTYTLNDVVYELDGKIERVRTDLSGRIDQLNTKIDGVEEKLTARIDGVEEKLTARIDGVEEKLTARIDGVEEKLTAQIQDLRSEIRYQVDRQFNSMHSFVSNSVAFMAVILIIVPAVWAFLQKITAPKFTIDDVKKLIDARIEESKSK